LKKKVKLGNAKKKAWSALSKAVRYAHAYDGDNCSCVTCGQTKHWKEQQAGHFIPKAQGNAIYFEICNVHPQCYRCNINLGGNGAEYYPYMLKTYGQGMIDRLKEKQQTIVKFKTYDYEDIEKHYKEEFKRIEELRKNGQTGIIEAIGY
jgi:NinG protein